MIYGYPYVTPGYSTADVVASSALAFGAGIAMGAWAGNDWAGMPGDVIGQVARSFITTTHFTGMRPGMVATLVDTIPIVTTVGIIHTATASTGMNSTGMNSTGMGCL